MKKYIGFIIVMCMFILVSSVWAAPQKVNFQGKLTNAAGTPVNGSVSMMFRIYDVASGGTALWAETQTVTVTNGVYNVLLGTNNPIDTELTETKTYWLGVKVGADAEMSPRVELTPELYDLIILNAMTVKNGNVGISTTNPSYPLHVSGAMRIDGDDVADAGKFSVYRAQESTRTFVRFETNNIDRGIQFVNNGRHTRGNYPGFLSVYQLHPESTIPPLVAKQYGTGPIFQAWSDSQAEFSILKNGNVGIGITPTAKLHVGYGTFQIGDLKLESFSSATGETIRFDRDSIRFWSGVSGTTAMHLQSNGNMTIYGTLHVTGADLAEPFDITDIASLELGDVVVIDPANPLHVTKSTTAYDKTVAGIVSSTTQAGYVAGSRSDGSSDKPIALVGRVLCKVSTENGAIEIGDLLTTSNTPGYAMKATDFPNAHGAIMGKALQAFDGEKGQIMVLVTLQ